MLEGGCSCRLGCLALVTSLVSGGTKTPLLEVAITRMEADVGSRVGRVSGSLQGEMLCNVFSNTRLGWEPVVEKWTFGLQMDRISEECVQHIPPPHSCTPLMLQITCELDIRSYYSG